MATATGIPKGKKRYCFTLTETTVQRLKTFVEKSQAPPSFVSSMIDELLLDVVNTFDELETALQRKGEKEQMSIGDLFTTIGKVWQQKEQGKLL